jgi:hypothetical protein
MKRLFHVMIDVTRQQDTDRITLFLLYTYVSLYKN